MGTKSNDGNVVAALLLRITTRPELNCLKQKDKVLLREIRKWEFSSRLKSLLLSPMYIRYWFLHSNRTQNLEERFGQTQIPTSNGNEKSSTGHQMVTNISGTTWWAPQRRMGTDSSPLQRFYTRTLHTANFANNYYSKDGRESFGENGQDAFLDKFLFKVCRT